jgi:hypothetical protein
MLDNLKYKKPNFRYEWLEAARYPEFQELGKAGWLQLAPTGSVVKYSQIKDVLENVNLDFESLDRDKRQRFIESYKEGVVETPIAVKFNDFEYDLLGGNTRLAGLIRIGHDPKIWVIQAPGWDSDESDDTMNESLKGGKADNMTLLDIAKKFNKKGYYDMDDMLKSLKKELHLGMKVELEHSKSRAMAKEIAMDHLSENPSYYSKLKKSEIEEGCWKGYKQIGGKLKNGKQVPNCVPIDESKEDLEEGENQPTNPSLWSRAKSLAKSKFDVYPSAYANGWASKWYKSKGGGWKKKSKNESTEEISEDLRRWFKEKWVDVSKKVDGEHPPCGRKDADGKSYPKCRPSKKVSKDTPKVASSYSKDEKKSMTQQKRRAEKEEPKVGKGNKPTMTHFDEMTGAASAGAFSAPMSFNKKDVQEAMDSGISAAAAFDVPLFGATTKGGRKNPLKIDGPESIGKSRAVKDKNFPKFGGPGGIYVKIKDKCKKFPYCNQGDINAIEVLRESIEESAKKHGLPVEEVEKIVLKGIKDIFI